MSALVNNKNTRTHAQSLVETWLARLNIPLFEGPQSNSGPRGFGDTVYQIPTTQNPGGNTYRIGGWVSKPAQMHGWDWRITIDLKGRGDFPMIILRRIDNFGNVVDMLAVDRPCVQELTHLDGPIVRLLKQGGADDTLLALQSRGLIEAPVEDVPEPPSVWAGFRQVRASRLVNRGVTLTEPVRDSVGHRTGIRKTFSTDEGDVHTFELSTVGDQTQLNIRGMGFTFAMMHRTPFTLPMVDHAFKYFFSAIQSDLLSSTSQERKMARVYENKLAVLGGLTYDSRVVAFDNEVSWVFRNLVSDMVKFSNIVPDRVRFTFTRTRVAIGIAFYPGIVSSDVRPLRFWMADQRVKEPASSEGCLTEACITVESSDPKVPSHSWFIKDLPPNASGRELLLFIRSHFEETQNTADVALIDTILAQTL